jgi:hypothetical protein
LKRGSQGLWVNTQCSPGHSRQSNSGSFTRRYNFQNAWSKAFEKEKIELNDEHKKLLEGGSSPDDVLRLAKELSDRERKGVRYRMSQIILPFVEGLKRFQGALDTLSQISPTVFGSIWGCVKVLLVVSSRKIPSIGCIDSMYTAQQRLSYHNHRHSIPNILMWQPETKKFPQVGFASC